MKQLRAALLEANPKFVLSLIWMYCPKCIPFRTYALHIIKDYIDYFVVTMLNIGSAWKKQYKGHCLLSAQDPYDTVKKHARAWSQVKGLEKHKVVIVFGWHGMEVECNKYVKENSQCFTRCGNLGSHMVVSPVVIHFV